jgi:O-succinylbenzoate-CoA ligase
MHDNIGLFLSKRAHLDPTLEAFVDVASGLRLSYHELNERANQTAHFLATLGIKKGDRVALLMLNCPAYLQLFFGLAKIGAVTVPLNIRLVADELAYIIQDSGSRLLLFGPEFRAVTQQLHENPQKISCVEDFIFVAGPDTTEPDLPNFALDYEELRIQSPRDEPEISAGKEEMLYIMYTSGTTGLPKGVVHTHNSAIWACITWAATGEFQLYDRYLLILPLYHVGALTPVTANVYLGATNVVQRTFDPGQAWKLIDEERIDTSLAVPAMLNFMIQAPELKTYSRKSLRWIMSGAAPVPASLISAYADIGIPINEAFGMTETCGPACLLRGMDVADHPASCGKAFFHTDIRVVDENGSDVRPGEPGEILIRGRHVMKEYWNNPEATKNSLRDGWLHSGDVATIDEDGFIYIKDRLTDMIISGGENVYPAEIENVILSHGKVADVAVIGQESERWGESPLAIVVKKTNNLSAEEIIAFCIGKLAPFKLPKGVEFIDVIPRNPSGKALKRELRSKFLMKAPE